MAGRGVVVREAESVLKRTRPPRRFTDATLLTAMETAGRALDDRELAAAMKDHGLGTPATRAEILETLIRRGYVEREGRSLCATDKGVGLVERVHPDAKSPALTAGWESELGRIQRGQADLGGFMQRIETHVRELVAATLKGARSSGAAPLPPRSSSRSQIPRPAVTDPGAFHSRPAVVAERKDMLEMTATADEPATPPAAGLHERLRTLLGTAFRLESFRPRQEAVCQAVAEGHDVLLVMPTGAGKSLCYQLPGLARAGTTLVISPLIALMEDQVGKLQALGLRAERIHSGRDKGASRLALQAYAEGRLDFLFVAPERLRVPGFAEALARRIPALVAVDEAHCISEWGHDFRPDYRLLGERLPKLRPAPVIALTATATPRVQDDIAAQLGLKPRRFIHGFRRKNIAIEIARFVPSQRADVVHRLLADAERRPAIVYAPTRREADALGAALAGAMPAAPYHAGMSTASRDRVQADFLAGRLEVVVATIAFGMGVDKADIRTVVHTALPGTLEGFSQEIGRAGRDGKQSRAFLLHSWNDRRTHEFFHEKSYPEPEVLERVFRALGSEPRSTDGLAARLRLDSEALETALEKLWIHGGAIFSSADGQQLVSRGAEVWRAPYERQREHRREQLDRMQRFADGHACRMAALVRHFGDQEDGGEACGTCDVCEPDACLVRSAREPLPAEREAAKAMIAALSRRDGQATGRLHTECGPAGLERRAFEEVLGGLARAGLLRVSADTFAKDGKTIAFQRAWLTTAARTASAADLRFTLPETAAGGEGNGSRRSSSTRSKRKAATPAVADDPALTAELKSWRLAESKRAHVPAFRVLHDRTLLAIAAARPQDEPALLAVPGMGPGLLKRYGERLLGICRASRPAPSRDSRVAR